MKLFSLISFVNFLLVKLVFGFHETAIGELNPFFVPEDNSPNLTTEITPTTEIPEDDVIEVDDVIIENMDYVSDLDTLLLTLGINEDIDIESTSDPDNNKRTTQAQVHFAKLIFKPAPLQLRQKENETEQISMKENQTIYMKNPKEAHCSPHLEVVDLGFSDDNPRIKYFPTCVRIKQCGGCCPRKSSLACFPTSKTTISVKVLQLREKSQKKNSRSKGEKRRRRSKYHQNIFNATVEEHNKCSCQCRVKEENCNSQIHSYDSISCSCVCLNTDEQSRCLDKRSHIWNSEKCQCLCRYPKRCSTGEGFDTNTCSCKQRSQSNFQDWFFKTSQINDNF